MCPVRPRTTDVPHPGASTLISAPQSKQLGHQGGLCIELPDFSETQILVDKTVKKINELVEAGELKEGQFGVLTYMMSKPELSYIDLTILTLSLFGDGLSTVSWGWIVYTLFTDF